MKFSSQSSPTESGTTQDRRTLLRAVLWVAASCLVSAKAGATTTLAVDLSEPIGPATHVASGSLYGVTETRPRDVDALVAPLRPKMFTNPAANVPQPVGDAIDVAERLAPLGATVTIRLADLLLETAGLPGAGGQR